MQPMTEGRQPLLQQTSPSGHFPDSNWQEPLLQLGRTHTS
jgi:hypothetical protein